MKRVTVKQTHVKHIKQQNPLILEEAIHGADKLHEGEIIALHAQQGEFWHRLIQVAKIKEWAGC